MENVETFEWQAGDIPPPFAFAWPEPMRKMIGAEWPDELPGRPANG